MIALNAIPGRRGPSPVVGDRALLQLVMGKDGTQWSEVANAVLANMISFVNPFKNLRNFSVVCDFNGVCNLNTFKEGQKLIVCERRRGAASGIQKNPTVAFLK